MDATARGLMNNIHVKNTDKIQILEGFLDELSVANLPLDGKYFAINETHYEQALLLGIKPLKWVSEQYHLYIKRADKVFVIKDGKMDIVKKFNAIENGFIAYEKGIES